VEFRILGPLEVEDGGRLVDLGGARERVLLARLLISANLAVPAERLAVDLWSGEPPAHWLPTLRVYISRLRRALGPGAAAVLTEPPGYRLRLAAGQLDADTFERLVAAARRDLADGRPEAAAAGLHRALGLWRGPALSDAADLPFARADAARLEEARLSAVEDWVEAELGSGRHASMAAELDGLVTSYPLRERLRGQRMRALYRCGRQADALRAYRELRAYLGEELGLEPSAALRELESAILRQDPALDWRAPPPGASPAPGPAPLAFAHADFLAEQDLLQESLGIWRRLGQPARVAQCLSDLGVAAHIRGELDAARSLLDEALESARLAADQRQIAMALNGLGRLSLQDDPARAAVYLEEGLACCRQAGDLRRATVILGNLAVAAGHQGQLGLARARMEEQLASARELGDRKLTGWALTNLGLLAIEVGDLAAARARQEEALRLAQEIGDRRVESYALTHRALVCQADGDYPAARTLHQRALRLAQALGEPRIIAENLEELARVEAADVNPGLAARLLGAAQALRERLGEPIAGPDLARHHHLIASVRQALGDPHYQAAWDQGRTMPEPQAITLAAATPAVRPRDDAAASSG